MTDSNYTHLTLVVDRSGSMESVRTDAQGGINTLLKEQYALPGKLTVTLVDFDDQHTTIVRMSDQPIEYELIPRNMTALADAVAFEIDRTGEDLAGLAEEERPGKVLFVVVTDGHENASVEHTVESVRAKAEHQKGVYAWEFAFIGAGDAAWQGEGMGMASSSYTQSAAGTRGAYQVMNASLGAFRAAPAGAVFSMPEVIDEAEEE